MNKTAMKIIAALLLSGVGIAAGPVPVPNPLFHGPKPLYPNLSPDYPVSNSLFSERSAYPYRESNPYLPESLFADADVPLSGGDLYSDDDLVAGGDLNLDGLALTEAERSQLLGLLTSGPGPVEGDDYSPFGYGPPQPRDPDWYEALGLVSPYDRENAGLVSPYDRQNAEDEYEDYLDDVGSWPQANSRQTAGQDIGISKKADPDSAAAAGQLSSRKPVAAAGRSDNGGDDSNDSVSEDDRDTAENLVKQIDELRKSIRKDALNSPASRPVPHQTRHTDVPSPSTSPTTSTSTAATPAGVVPEKSVRSPKGEAPLVDQLRAAAAEPFSVAETAPRTEAETAYETIKRLLVMKDELNRLPKKMTKKAKRFVSDPFTKQLEDLRVMKT